MPKPKPNTELKPADQFSTEQVVNYLNNAVIAVTRWDKVDRSHSRLLKMRGLVEGVLQIMRETQEVDAAEGLPEGTVVFSTAEVCLVLQTAALLCLVQHLDPADPLRRRAALGIVALPEQKPEEF